jgi:uncharacterized OB-fold protein
MQGFLLIVMLTLAGVLIAYGWYASVYDRCPSCQKRIRTIYSYCPHCGSRVFLPQSLPSARGHHRVSRIKIVPARKQTRTRREESASMSEQTRSVIPPSAFRPLPREEETAWNDWRSRAPTFRSLRHTPISRLLVRSHCPSCQTTIHEEDAFCGQCGTPLPISPKKATP